MTTNCDFCLASKNGPAWLKVPNLFEGQLQSIIRLRTEDNEQVIVPATSLLASSVELRRVIRHGNYLPLAYTATEVIIPGVTVGALKHVAEIVTTGKSDRVGRKVFQDVKEVLHLFQIVGEFKSSWSGEVEENVVENENGDVGHSKEGHADNSEEGHGCVPVLARSPVMGVWEMMQLVVSEPLLALYP